MADSTPKSYHTDPNLYLYTSLTSGSSHIVTATSRLSTILKANKIPFLALDVATDEKARMLWGRRAGKRKLPGLVRMGMIVGDLEEVEEWNEYGELKENVEPAGTKAAPASTPTPSAANTPSKPSAASSTPSKPSPAPIKTTAESPGPTSSTDPLPANAPSTTIEAPLTTALRQAGFEAAKKATDAKSKARKNALEAAKAKDNSLQRLEKSGPTGMPPPSGTTEAEDAKEPETAGAKVKGKADHVPVTGDGVAEVADGSPSAKKAAKVANTALMDDQSEEVLEGTGQAEPPAPKAQDIPSLASPPPADEVSSASEVEAAANESIAKDKSHVILKGKKEVDRTPPSEREYAVQQEASEEAEPVGGTPLKQVTATNEAQDLPGKTTQDQEAAKGDEAGNSVAD